MCYSQRNCYLANTQVRHLIWWNQTSAYLDTQPRHFIFKHGHTRTIFNDKPNKPINKSTQKASREYSREQEPGSYLYLAREIRETSGSRWLAKRTKKGPLNSASQPAFAIPRLPREKTLFSPSPPIVSHKQQQIVPFQWKIEPHANRYSTTRQKEPQPEGDKRRT